MSFLRYCIVGMRYIYSENTNLVYGVWNKYYKDCVFVFLSHNPLLDLFGYVNCVLFYLLFVNKIIANVNK